MDDNTNYQGWPSVNRPTSADAPLPAPDTDRPVSEAQSPVLPTVTKVETPTKRRRGRSIATVTLAIALTAGAFGIGRATAPTDASPETPIALEAIAEPAKQPATTTTTTTSPAPTTTVPASDLEPVAAVAAAVGPSVVQINTASGLGSGVIYDESGLILTAAHVVAGSQDVSVRLADGRFVDGTVLGTHDDTDIAVISIDATGLQAATLWSGDDLQVGQLAVALGSPFGFDQTVTSGIVSATNRIVRNATMVQTDAAINPGNSGGPLVNGQGQVIGINDIIFSNGGGNEGVGFAVDIRLAKLVADQIVAGEEVSLARLGVLTASDPSGAAGAYLQQVDAGSAAAAAGLESGDLIVGYDGNPVRDGSELRAMVINELPGNTVSLEVVRGGSTLELDVELGRT
ncbi:MAG: trypsin-like serine protease [Acidimicrobiia bacterium]|nr:trypsin-like peptidase domain-containing protein [Acidimicrobiia bacterium]NNF63043.1 trypsin-like serine protease [Acidimicrobiia bacterium]